MVDNDYAMDADRTPRDPEAAAGKYIADPWDAEPLRWVDTEPLATALEDARLSGVPTAVPVALMARATWTLTLALTTLRATFNIIAPNRDKASDGSIGDPAHASSSSDHNPDETGNVPIRDADSINEVHAIDVDDSGPWPADARGPFTVMRAVRQLVSDHRAGRENRLRYVIYERTIWSASWGWAARDYTGANPHDHHAHFSGSYDTAKERDTRPWNIGYVPVEETVSATDVIEGMNKPVEWRSTGVRDAAVAAGWTGLYSSRALLEYLFAATVLDGPRDKAEILAAVAGVDEEVMRGLGDASQDDATVADALRVALGDRAERVGALLAAGPQ